MHFSCQLELDKKPEIDDISSKKIDAPDKKLEIERISSKKNKIDSIDVKEEKSHELIIPVKASATEIKVPENDQLSMVFTELRIQKYIGVFQEEEYGFEDLFEISMEEIDALIPKMGPRNKLKRWIASRRSTFAKPVLRYLKSVSDQKQLFTDKFRESLISLSKTHAATMSAIALVEGQSSYMLDLMGKSKPEKIIHSKDAFLSHVQKYSMDLCRSLLLSLRNKEIEVWYDKEADRLDTRGMVEGIFTSSEFVIVMVKDYFERTYCVFEYLVAAAFRKPITVLLENDTRVGGLTINELPEVVPKLYYDRVTTHEIINVNRDYFDSFVAKVGKRLARNKKVVS